MNARFPVRRGLPAALALALAPASAHAAGSAAAAEAFAWLALILVAARLGSLLERWRQPAVLGEILVGVVIANVALLGLPDIWKSEALPFIDFLAQLGAVILLFQIGLESNIQSMRRVGGRAFAVACVGVVVPFVLGTFIVGPLLLPGMSEAAYLFLGAALTATSVGITGRVFRDMNCLLTREAQIVLGAAVIDDVLGLIVLSVVSAIATQGTVSAASVALLSAQALGFLVAAVVLGQMAAGHLSRLFAAIHPGAGTKLAVALGFGLLLAWLAHLIGLAPIVGAFAAGLVLDEVQFRHFDDPTIKTDLLEATRLAAPETRDAVRTVVDAHAHKHLEHMLEPVGHLLVPVFFVVAGMQVKLEHLADPRILLLALALTVAAVIGKVVAGGVAGPVNRWLVGWGMVPRGEVGLIFAFVGKQLGVVDDQMFSVIVLMVMFTTLITPPVLGMLLQRKS